jgi:hypothetical protein
VAQRVIRKMQARLPKGQTGMMFPSPILWV